MNETTTYDVLQPIGMDGEPKRGVRPALDRIARLSRYEWYAIAYIALAVATLAFVGFGAVIATR